MSTPESRAEALEYARRFAEARQHHTPEFSSLELKLCRELLAAQAELEAERRIRSPEANWAWPQLIRIEKALDGGDRETAQDIGNAVVAELQRLRVELNSAHRAARAINEALNMGDGAYRP